MRMGRVTCLEYRQTVAPQTRHLRGVLSFCNARQMTAPEAYIRFAPEIFPGDGEVTDESTKAFLTKYMNEFATYIGRVLTVIPRP